MKQLLNTLYITTPDTYLSLEDSNVAVWQGEKRLGKFPLSILEGIVYFGYKGASPQLLGACAEQGIGFSFYSQNGRFRARIAGRAKGNVLLRKTQYRISEDQTRACEIAQCMVFGKISNARSVLERARRDHPLQVDVDAIVKQSNLLARYLFESTQTNDPDSLRGIEGSAARAYFAVFDELILANKDAFQFGERQRRPPRDPVNVMLSFAYTLLKNDCASAIEGAGLDSYVGFIHTDRPGRESLALDLMEELRPVFADRAVLTCINKRKITPKHFDYREDGSVLLNDAGRKIFIEAWQARKRDELRHPYLDKVIPWGLVPHVQSLLLARYIRGDLDGYPPFLWK